MFDNKHGGIIMNDILASQAFQEFLQKRCEEIIASDKECCDISNLIVQKEDMIKAKAPAHLLPHIIEYEKLSTDYVANAAYAVCRQIFYDFYRLR
jgi:hypothetical protein